MCIDVRQESCFTEFKHGQGSGVIEGLYPRTICCCSGVGKAWGGPAGGDRCEVCPKQGTPGFNDLCPKVNIRRHRVIKRTRREVLGLSLTVLGF